MRAEEARALSMYEGYHRFNTEDDEEVGSFEVFWDDEDKGPYGTEPRNYSADGTPVKPGLCWWSCFPGCLPDGEAHGPFASSAAAHSDALEI